MGTSDIAYSHKVCSIMSLGDGQVILGWRGDDLMRLSYEYLCSSNSECYNGI